MISKTWEDFINGLGGRAKSFLKRHSLNSFSKLSALSLDDLVAKSGCGTSTANELCFRMNLFGHEMKPNKSKIDNWPLDLPANASGPRHNRPVVVDVDRQNEFRESMKALTFKLPLRDLCAFEAMGAVIRNDPGDVLTFSDVANLAYKYADAMMDRREQKQEGA